MTELVQFIRARLDEDEATAKACPEVGWFAAEWDQGAVYLTGTGAAALLRGRSFPVARHAARHDPARVLDDVAAKRRIIDQIAISQTSGVYDGTPFAMDPAPAELIMRELAAPWVGHPDYRPEWRP